jgi:hypothetical protein
MLLDSGTSTKHDVRLTAAGTDAWCKSLEMRGYAPSKKPIFTPAS